MVKHLELDIEIAVTKLVCYGVLVLDRVFVREIEHSMKIGVF